MHPQGFLSLGVQVIPTRAEIERILQETAVPAGLHFQLATTSDFRPLADLGFSSQPIHQFQDTFERLLAWQADGRCCWLVVRHESAIIGSGQLIVYPHSSELANLFVVPVWRSQGVGSAMMAALTAVARALALTALEISVAPGNEHAVALYRRLGFNDDRRVRLPNQETALVLRKAL